MVLLLQQEYSPAHKALRLQWLLCSDRDFELVDHPPYSPDLAAIATTDLCADDFPDEAAPHLWAFPSVS